MLIKKCNIKIYILLSIFIFFNNNYAQLYSVKYKEIRPFLFLGFEKPIGIAIYPIIDIKGDNTKFTDLIYKKLVEDKVILNNYIFYPYNFLLENKKDFGINDYNITTKSGFKYLYEILGASFILTGNITLNDVFKIDLYRITDSLKIYSANYKNTFRSKAIDDLLMLFKENKTAIYDKLEFNFDMVMVKGGEFKMGSKSGDEDKKPIHDVYIDDFYISRYEVTFDEYDIFCDATGKIRPDDRGWGRGKRPVINISWFDANEYIKWLTKLTKEKYRLPTEAEWEYASKGGKFSSSFYYSGSNKIDNVSWYSKNSMGKTHKVGEKQPNELGIYDMTGNVWEWCSDWYNKNYYSLSPINNPQGPEKGTDRVARGGSWISSDILCSNSIRLRYNPYSYLSNVGFRIVKDK